MWNGKGSLHLSEEQRCAVLVVLPLVLFLLISATAIAELQNVKVGGSIEINAAYYSKFYESQPGVFPRIPPDFLPFRAIGAFGTFSNVRSDGTSNKLSYIEQRTRLHVDADFTDQVRAFVEFDSIDQWGEDFRSANYLTGFDNRAASIDDIEVYQAYIEASEFLNLPLQLRIGRQEMTFGCGWLVGANPAANPFTGLSFDAFRLTYTPTDKLTIDAWASKLFENGVVEEDGDTDFYGLYAQYKATENMEFDLYWMYVRDATSRNDTNFPWFVEWIENWVGVDNYDVTNLHTVGARWSGSAGGFDWDAEAAYQFGNADNVGSLFVPFVYGPRESKYDNWAARFDGGYTFESVPWKPRAYLSFDYYGGQDNRSVSFWEWLNPFDSPKASVSFNRLFSDDEVDYFFDGSALSNHWCLHVGVETQPTEKIGVSLDVLRQEVSEAFRMPTYFRVGSWRVPIAPNWPFLDTKNARDLGWQTTLAVTYDYSEDLSVEVGWAHLFTGKAVQDGSFIDGNGLVYIEGRGTDDADFLYCLTTLKF